MQANVKKNCPSPLPPLSQGGKKGASMLVLNEDSSVESEQYSKEEHNYTRQLESGHSDDEAKTEEMINEVQEKQDDDDEATESDKDKEDDFPGQFDDADYEGVIFVQEDVLCNIQQKAGIPASCILLDSQSTVDVFCNARMLTNICDTKRHFTLHCNARTTSVTKKGDLKVYGSIWCHPDGIANILSLNHVKKKYKVTFDSKLNDGFIVHMGNGSQRLNLPLRGYTTQT